MWKVGDLAKRTGVSVRTLHHYEAIGLLRSAARSEGGHRCYTDAEVERLHRILSMRELGFSLEDIGGLLDTPGYQLLPIVKLHRERVAAQIEAQKALAGRLGRLQARLEQGGEVPVSQLLETMEDIKMIDNYLTPDQITALQAAHEKDPSSAKFRETVAALRQLRDEGKRPGDPEVQAVARRHLEYARPLAGANPELGEGLRRLLQGQPEVRERLGLDMELLAFFEEALNALA